MMPLTTAEIIIQTEKEHIDDKGAMNGA